MVAPGDKATIPSPRPTFANFTSTDPSARRLAWVVTVEGESKPWTEHQVTVSASGAEARKTPPPAEGSRSAKKGPTRARPESKRAMPRWSWAVSARSNVMLPSEFTKRPV